MLVLSAADRRSWISHLIFWGANLGLAVFVAGLIVDTPEMKRIGAPVMGPTLYVALAILARGAVSASMASAEVDLAESA